MRSAFETEKREYLADLSEMESLTAYALKIIAQEEHDMVIMINKQGVLEVFLNMLPRLIKTVKNAKKLEDIKQVGEIMSQQQRYIEDVVLREYYLGRWD